MVLRYYTSSQDPYHQHRLSLFYKINAQVLRLRMFNLGSQASSCSNEVVSPHHGTTCYGVACATNDQRYNTVP